MSEETAVKTPEIQANSKPPKTPNAEKRRRARRIRSAVITVLVVCALAVGGFFLYRFLNKSEPVDSMIQTATAKFSSIQSTVQGSGSARSKESTAITLKNAGIVQYVYVTEGQVVSEGDPLYEIVSPAAQEAYDAAVKRADAQQEELNKARENLEKLRSGNSDTHKRIAELQKDLAKRQEEYQNLLDDQRKGETDRFVKAPFAGQLQDVVRFEEGAHIGKDTKIATLVDDSRFRIPFYFSYAYEGKITCGMAATVNVGSTTLAGTVDEVVMVRRVSPEGSLLFEATVVVENPGALTKGLSATASLRGADGTVIYPYDAGTLDYYRTADILTKTEGDLVSTQLRNYKDVAAGEVVLTLSSPDYSEALQEKNDQIISIRDNISAQQDSIQESIQAAEEAVKNAEANLEDAQDKVEEARKALEDFSAVAPISGTITSCAIAEGQEVKNGDTVITISNNTTMIVTIQVDDRNIAYVKPGMGVDLQSNWGNGGSFYGVVTKIDMSLSGDSIGSGMTNYPVTLEVDNFDGSLLEGMWLSYSFITSQSDGCIVVPMQSVKYVSTDDGGTASVVFIQADSKPDNALDLDIPEALPGEAPSYPSPKDGYYPVPVSTGLSDNYNVEITEGLMGGETVFVNYLVTQADSWGDSWG